MAKPTSRPKGQQTKQAGESAEAHRSYSIFVDWMAEQANQGIRFQTMDEALAAFEKGLKS